MEMFHLFKIIIINYYHVLKTYQMSDYQMSEYFFMLISELGFKTRIILQSHFFSL